MSSIFGALGLATQALQAQQFGLEVTQRNIANVNTPGYSRQQANFTVGEGDSASGDFAITTSLASFRNRFLDYQVTQELQSQGKQDAISTALQQIEPVLNQPDGVGLSDALAKFFNSFSALSSAPEDRILRQQVLSSAQALTQQFHSAYSKIQAVQISQDSVAGEAIREINSLTSDIARLNVRITEAQGQNSPDESLLRDQRQQLTEKLSELVDVSYFETDSGELTVTTRQGAFLVVGDESHPWESVRVGSSLQIVVDGADIASGLTSGKLGGVLELRNKLLPGYLKALDDLAATLIQSTNTQHTQGSDLNGVAGGNFFVPFVPPAPGLNVGAARSITLAISDPTFIAAADAGNGPGDGANAQALASIKDAAVFGAGRTPSEAYAELVFGFANDSRDASNGLQTQQQILVQLQNQRDSVSGVNLDEEAVNMIRFQRAYEASARFVQVLDSLSEELIKLLGA